MKKSYDKGSGKLLPYIFALLFVSGVVIGTTLAARTDKTLTFELGNTGRLSVFISSLKSFLKPCFIIWIAGFTGFSSCISAVAIAYRGGIFGFAVAMFFKVYGLWGGLIRSLSCTLPQNLVYFPFLLFLSLSAVGKKKNTDYLIMLALSVCVCAISAFIDTFITSNLIKFTF